jgi:uncharacterized membrane protein
MPKVNRKGELEKRGKMMIYLLHGIHDAWIGTFHPMLVHFPIVFFTLTLFSDILYYLGRDYGLRLGAIFLWAGTLFAIPTAFTGWEASESFPAADPDVTKHMILAFSLAGYALAYSIFRILVWRKGWVFPAFVFLTLSLILTTLTSWTSNRGGVLSHGQTPFSTKTAP